jgi:putative transposase
MDDYERLAKPQQMGVQIARGLHSQCRRKTLYGELRQHLREVFRRLAMQKECSVEEGHSMPDHAHMMIRSYPNTQYRK